VQHHIPIAHGYGYSVGVSQGEDALVETFHSPGYGHSAGYGIYPVAVAHFVGLGHVPGVIYPARGIEGAEGFKFRAPIAWIHLEGLFQLKGLFALNRAGKTTLPLDLHFLMDLFHVLLYIELGCGKVFGG